jgi:methionyl-tRNA formyltransferase
VKLAFLGTPEVAAGTLRALVGAGHSVVHVVTRPDARRGRGPQTGPSPVKRAAAELGAPVSYRPEDLIGEPAELGVVVAYGRLVKPPVLAALPLVNVHFSLLPRWRGAAPVERAILAGDAETGVCLMALEEGLDTGPVYARVATPIGPEETAVALRQRLGELGNRLLVDVLAAGLPVPHPQAGEPVYADKIRPDELRLDFSRPAVEVERVVRVGRAWTTFRGRRLLVVAARVGSSAGRELAPGQLDGRWVGTGAGALELVRLQPEGKGPMDAAAWARGVRPQASERLGS